MVYQNVLIFASFILIYSLVAKRIEKTVVIIALDIGMPHKETIILTAICTILLSVIAHGFTANPFIKRLNNKKLSSMETSDLHFQINAFSKSKMLG